jgi:hypothetical protein
MAKLTINEQYNGFTDKHVLTYDNLTETATIIGYIPAGGVVNRCAVQQITADAGGQTDITLNVGTTEDDPDEMINALDLDGLTQAAFNTGDVLINTAAGYVINNTTDAVPIYYKNAGTVGSVTAGEWVISWNVMTPPSS